MPRRIHSALLTPQRGRADLLILQQMMPLRSALDELTVRERTVLTLIAEGRSNRAIAKQLHLSARAIERHVQGIFEKLGLPATEDDNRRVLAVLAMLGR